MRFPSIPNVARAVRILSASLPEETTVQLLVSPDGAWEVVPGELYVSGVHDRCFVGMAKVPGQNRAARPRRFRSEDTARTLINQSKVNPPSQAPSQHQARQSIQWPRLQPQVAQVVQQAAPQPMPTQAAPANANAMPTRRMARGSSSPVATHHQASQFAVGAQVAFHGVVGRVVGHALVESTTGPCSVHLVQTAPAYVPQWNMNISILPVMDSEIQPFAPGLHARAQETWATSAQPMYQS
jgi:hypothetical protein